MKKRIGELLIDAGVISESTVNTALREKRADQKIGDYLVGKGYVKEEILYQKLSEQLKTPLFKLSEVEFKSNIFDIVSKDLLKKHIAFPIELSGSLLTIAMSDPLDENAISEIEEAIQVDVSAVLATKSEILDYINKYYDIDDSIQEFFNIQEEDLNDKNQLQVIDMVTSIVTKNKKLNLVISQSKSRIELTRGVFGNSTIKELQYLLNFIKKITGFNNNEDESKFNVILNREDGSKINISLMVIERGTQKEFWIEARLIEYKEILGNNRLESIRENGLYIIVNPKFKNKKSFIESLVGLNKGSNYKDKVLLCTDDVEYEGYGLKVLDIDKKEIPYFNGFAEIFVFEDGWNIDNLDSVLHLLSREKVVLLQVPFKDKEECENYFKGIKNGSTVWNLVSDVLYI